jgi:hypothetical protein
MKPETYPLTQSADPAYPVGPALRAVQVALDRRDNGGDVSAINDQAR